MCLQLPVLHTGKKQLKQILLKNPEAHLIQPLFLCLFHQKPPELLQQPVGLPCKNHLSPVRWQDHPLLPLLLPALAAYLLFFHILNALLAEHIILAEPEKPGIRLFHLLAENVFTYIAEDLCAKHLLTALNQTGAYLTEPFPLPFIQDHNYPGVDHNDLAGLDIPLYDPLGQVLDGCLAQFLPPALLYLFHIFYCNKYHAAARVLVQADVASLSLPADGFRIVSDPSQADILPEQLLDGHVVFHPAVPVVSFKLFLLLLLIPFDHSSGCLPEFCRLHRL